MLGASKFAPAALIISSNDLFDVYFLPPAGSMSCLPLDRSVSLCLPLLDVSVQFIGGAFDARSVWV